MAHDPLPTVACVLKKGGVYDFNYVKILSLAVRRRFKRAHKFVCLTDTAPPHRDWLRAHRINLRPLMHVWPGAWAKIELFRPGLFFGRVLYFDLGTLATGSLRRLADYRGAFAALSNFRYPTHLDCTVMAWHGGTLDFIYDGFAVDPLAAMIDYEHPSAWIERQCRIAGLAPHRIQDVAPGLCATATPILGGSPIRIKPPGVGILCFQGRPKPHELVEEYDFVREQWV